MVMRADHLSEDELEWELLVRNISFTEKDTFADKQRLWRASLRPIGEERVVQTLPPDIDLNEELGKVSSKVEAINSQLSGGAKAKDLVPLKSKLIHLKSKTQLLLSKGADYLNGVEALRTIGGALGKLDPSEIDSELSVSDLLDFGSSTGAKPKQTSDTADVIAKTKPPVTQPSNKDVNPNIFEDTVEAEIDRLGTRITNLYKVKRDLEKKLSAGQESKQDDDDTKSDDSGDLRAELIRESLSMLADKMESQTKELSMKLDKKEGLQQKQLKCSAEKQFYPSSEKPKHRKSSEIPVQCSRFVNLSFQSDSESELNESEDENPHKSKSRKSDKGLAISKWNVKFSGEGGLSLVDFFRQVDMYVETEGMSEGKLVRKAGQLFKGAALEWYMSSKHRFKRWKHIVQGLREAFLPEDADFFILQQCDRRQQQKNETFELFWAKMNKLFDSLSSELPEQQKLNILKRNLKPAHRIGIALVDIRTIEELRVHCRRLDGLDPSLYGNLADGNSNRHGRPQICELEENDGKKKKKGKEKEKTKKTPKAKDKSKEKEEKEEKEVAEIQNKTSSQEGQGYRQNQNRPRNNQGGGPRFGRNFQRNQNQWYNGFQNWPWPQQLVPTNPYFQMAQPNFQMPQPNYQAPYSGNSIGNMMEQWAKQFTSNQPAQQQQNQGGAQGGSQAKAQNTGQQQQQQQKSVCWNCDGEGHMQKYCLAPRRVFCYGCGHKNVYINECPTCSGNGSQRTNQ
jgi:hypothetical protein